MKSVFWNKSIIQMESEPRRTGSAVSLLYFPVYVPPPGVLNVPPVCVPPPGRCVRRGQDIHPPGWKMTGKRKNARSIGGHFEVSYSTLLLLIFPLNAAYPAYIISYHAWILYVVLVGIGGIHPLIEQLFQHSRSSSLTLSGSRCHFCK